MRSTAGATPIFQQILNRFPGREAIKYWNADKVEGLLKKLIEGTEHSLQVITDFDQTLTKHHNNGVACCSSYGVFDHSPLMPEEYKKKNLELYGIYHPMEICHEMSISEKIPHMIKWYEASCGMMVKEGNVNRSMLQPMVKTSKLMLRDNAVEMLQTLNKAQVPVLIFSAGIGDILQTVVEGQNAMFPNIKIVSNWMKFDDSGSLIGFKKPFIHTFNKNETVLSSEDLTYFDELSHRPNAILLGDNVGDIQMANGMPSQVGVLKIGFLNLNIEERLESFLQAFDIVIADDQSMDFVNLLLSVVLNSKS